MNLLLKQMLLACICLFALAVQATELSDAERAYDEGTFAKAAKIFRFLAEQGNALAQYNLGKMYYRGHGVPQDAKEAARWLQLAAEQGEAKAQFQLGIMYYRGHGVPQNSTEEARWYRLAAEQGHALAQYDLGFMYAHGQGVPKDYKEAVKWYRLAAEQGDTFAQYNLGMMYCKGRGVPQNNVLAHMWINLAATNAIYGSFQSRYAGTRDGLVAKAMTASQIIEAQKLAKKCTASKFKGC